MKNIAFIGIGVMGKAMAENLIHAGYKLSIYSRTKEKAAELISIGAKWFDDICGCISGTDAVVTMVGFPNDVEQVYFGAGGIIENASAGQYIIDMTTTSPELSIKIFEAAENKGVFALDAPVSGGDIGAKSATLSIMVGGERSAYEACKKMLEAMGTTIIYEGNAGKGQHTKMANQIAIAGTISGVAEAIAYGKSQGLDMETLFASITNGAAGSFQLAQIGPKMAVGDYEPGFYLKHFVKDMKIAVVEAERQGLHLKILKDVLNIYKKLEAKGMENLGTQAIMEYYSAEATTN